MYNSLLSICFNLHHIINQLKAPTLYYFVKPWIKAKLRDTRIDFLSSKQNATLTVYMTITYLNFLVSVSKHLDHNIIFLMSESNTILSLRYNIDQHTTKDQSKFSVSYNLNTVELNDNAAETITINVKLSPTEGLKR